MRKILAAAMLAVLAACSAGGGTAPQQCSGSTCTVPVASLVISLNKASINNSGSDSAIVTVTALDANRNALPGATVTMVPDSGVLDAGSTTTDTSGNVTGTLNIGGDKTNRTIAIVAKSGNVSANASIAVTGSKLTATATPNVITPGGAGSIAYLLTDVNGAAMANVPITISGITPPTAQPVTDANGHYTLSYTAPASAVGSIIITAQAAGTSIDSTISVTSGTVPPATGTITSATLQPSPSVINVNTAGSSANQVELVAQFLGANNAPIKNVRVRFDLDGDVNNIGGTLASGTDYVYSDDNGIARTQYIPGTRGSGTNKVTLRGCYSNNDFAVVTSGSPCPNNQEVTTQVTVIDAGTSVVATTSLVITANDLQSSYSMPFAVRVVDAAGHPRSGVRVSYQTKLTQYIKGSMSYSGGIWTYDLLDINGGTIPKVCENEDLNGNLKLDGASAATNEDANGNGRLDPVQAFASLAPQSTGSDTTDSFGQAYFTLTWGQTASYWNYYLLQFTAVVDGTEGHTSYGPYLLLAPAGVVKAEATPPWYVSPYGVQTSGTVQVANTDTGVITNLCNNGL